MISIIDSHCHLQDDAFSEDREDVWQRAQNQGIGCIVPGYTMTSSWDAVNFARSHDEAWALVGVHPHDAKDVRDEDYETLKDWARQSKVIGIGEVGLDYHYNHSEPFIQKEVFQRQLKLAVELGLPVSVHSRDAEEDTLQIIDGVPGAHGVLHCFTGSLPFALALIDRDWFISFSGAITFKSAHELRKIVQEVPLDHMLIETDSPYLSPVPWRGQRNEPLRVVRVAEIVAAQKNISTKEVFSVTMSNVQKIFSMS